MPSPRILTTVKTQQRLVPGVTSRFAGASGIRLSELFADRIWRTPPWDRLIHSYLAALAFTPSWDFNLTFAFEEEMLIPWPALERWTPDRVHSWLAWLEEEIAPERYRTLAITFCTSPDEVRRAGECGMDMVWVTTS